MPDYVDRSILEVRTELTDTLKLLDTKADSTQNIRAMRAACRKFLDKTEQIKNMDIIGETIRNILLL
jgi:hypothetical protein